MNRPLNAIVAGVGSLGQHHARIYSEHPEINLLAVIDIDETVGKSIAEKWNTKWFHSIDEVQDTIDIASVVVPTESHLAVASNLINRGVSVLVEKPIAITVEEGEHLVQLAKEKGVLLQVGHIERFNPGVVGLGEYLEKPLFIESHRLGPPTPRVKDVGVILDLMIHDLDLILSLVKSEIEFIDAVGVPIITGQEDIANARIRFKSGCVANVTVSRVTPERQRKIRFFQRDTYLSLDYMKPELQIFKKIQNADGTLGIDFKKPELKKHEPLAAEINSFVECVQQGKQPVVTGEDGVQALKLAETITAQVKNVAKQFCDWT